ncbi:MAG: hypothetical protein HOH43_25515 [Candidatus Latescibacteria bacterium]|nr:hypothetical protein [Candidatus Latescibacterota bacterium]
MLDEIRNSTIRAYIQACVICLVFLCPDESIASDNLGASFLRLASGARALGFGGTFISLADDGSAAYWNPAGLAQITKPQVTLNYASLFESLAEHRFFNAAFPINEKTVLGVSVMQLDVDDIPGINSNIGSRGSVGVPLPGSPLKDRETAYVITVARMNRYQPVPLPGSGYVPIEMPYAVNVKLVRQTFGNDRSTGIGVDAGYMLKVGLVDAVGSSHAGHVALGVTGKDIIGTRIYWKNRPNETIKPSFRMGFSYTQPLKPLNSTFVIAQQNSIYNGDSFRLGVEYWYRNAIALRIGESEELTAGAGIIVWRTMLDYAFLNQGNGGSHHVSVSLNF